MQMYITQYGSTVYYGWSSITAIRKDITFSFNLNLSSKDIKVENMSKSNCMQKIG